MSGIHTGPELWDDGDADRMADEIATLRAELAAARETNRRLNRRVQLAEAAARDNVEACIRKGASFGRMLANWSAGDQRREKNRWQRIARWMAAEARYYRALLRYSVVTPPASSREAVNASIFVDHVHRQVIACRPFRDVTDRVGVVVVVEASSR